MARVYVSCSEQDRDLSARIKDWLRFQDYEPVSLQDEASDGGTNMAQWHRQFAQTLDHCDLVILVLTPDWANSKWCFAEFTEAYSIGKTILAVIEKPLDEPFSEPGIPVFDLTSERESGLSKLAMALRGSLSGAGNGPDFDPERPVYPGLRSYEEKDSPIFFSRDDDVRRAIDRLNTRRRQGGARLIALLGAPGTGISSLMMGGVLPRLHRDHEGWIVLPVMRPTLKPIDEFARSIATLLGNVDLWKDWAELFRGHDFKGVARELAEQLRDRFGRASAHILLPIDQAEELFSIADTDDAEQFLDVLGAIFDDDMPYVGVAALRPDFLEDFQTADQLSHVVEEFSPRLMPLSTIREIITKPGELIQLPIEDDLVETILQDALEEGALPLVSVVLHQMYIHTGPQEGMTLAAYRSIGTDYSGKTPLGNIIARLAEEIIEEEELNEGQLLTLEEVFTQKLLWKDNDNRFVSRPLAMDDINLKTRVVVRRFIEAGLLVARDVDGFEMVEYTHISVLDHWPRLRSWLVEKAEQDGAAALPAGGAIAQLAPPTSEKSDGFEPEEISAASFRLEEDSFKESGFIDEAHNYVQAEILGPETMDPRYSEEEERLAVPPSIFNDRDEGYATPEKFAASEKFSSTEYATPETGRVEAPEFVETSTDADNFTDDRFSKASFIDEGDELREEDSAYAPGYANTSLAPRTENFDYEEPPKKKSSKARFAALGLAALILVGAGALYLPAIKGKLPGNDVTDVTGPVKFPAEMTTLDEDEVVLEKDNKSAETGNEARKTASLDQSKEVTLPGKEGRDAPKRRPEFKLNKDWPLLKLAVSFEALNSAGVSKTDRAKAQGDLVDNLQKMKDAFMLEGHKGQVKHVAFDPGGIYVATASEDGTIRIWDLLTGHPVNVLFGHGAAVNSVAFSPDGRTIVSASDDKTARIWDVEKGVLIKTLSSHKRPVTHAEFNSVGDKIATASKDRTAHIWNVDDGQLLFKLTGHEATVNMVTFSKNGSWIATASQDNTGRIWDASSGQQMVSLRGHSKAVRSIRFGNEDNMVITGSADKTINLWHTFSGKKSHSLVGHLEGVESASISPDGNLVLSTSSSGDAILWNREQGVQLTTIRGRADGLMKAVFSSNGDWIAAASQGKVAHLLPAQLFVDSKVFEGHTDRVFSGTLDKNGEYILTASRDNTARIWNVESGAQEVLLIGHVGQVHHGVFSPDQQSIATASKDKSIRIWDRETGKTLRIFKGDSGAVNRIAFSPDGKQIAAAYQNNLVQVWDVDSGTVLQTLEGHEGPVWSVVYSSDGERIFSASNDETIRVWSAANGVELNVLKGHSKSVLALSLSPDGKTLASGSVDGTVRFWDTKTLNLKKTVLKQDNIITSLGFSSEGDSIVTGSFDKVARLWDIKTGKVVWQFANHDDRVLSVSLNEDGNWALTTSSDNAYLWRVFSAPELSFYVKSILPRCLSRSERGQMGLGSEEPAWCKNMEEWRAVRSQ